ncbi:Gfo/Idh/MocA family protein [Lacrimispora sp.]|uniref:Gfo/Idh/MocA family protein n=1 Tax=Lacrimispora sp. TaxID=2719234 RepID=UPI002867A968|nr:Gfo/Idh/MocA family oxidoreductase [Lacrimispora sp.]MDR7813630.1 Gfo/Idh/MocA family oxidoreductase [Lacrimispora sp.]
MQKSDGMNYAPQGKAKPVVKPGEFIFAVTALKHGHIYGMTNGLVEAGATLKYVYDDDPKLLEDYCRTYPQAIRAESLDQILADPDIRLVAAAAIPCDRAALGFKVMEAGKDYFTDKSPFTTLEQIEMARSKVKSTGQKYMVYFSERLHVESAVYAGQLIKDGVIGDVLQVMGMGPHRLNAPSRPQWFFQKEKYGGILCDIGSHQIEQYLFFSGSTDARVVRSQVANHNHPEYPEFEDFGEVMLVGDNGSSNYFRVDWFTPDGLGSWGDGRLFILGTKGYIELRKYINVGVDNRSDHVFYVTGEKEHYINVSGQVGYPFFGELILDCINRTEIAMTQEHAFKAAELCIMAQMAAEKIR